jgi:1,4-alpha-glucan branching enzyme
MKVSKTKSKTKSKIRRAAVAQKSPKLDQNLQAIIDASHHDPFTVLGRHRQKNKDLIRCFLPHAERVTIADNNQEMQRIEGTDFFEWQGDASELAEHYRFIWRDDQHREHIAHDPYTFAPQLGDMDLHLFSEGKHWHAYRFLGAHLHECDGIAGVLFSVWAPNAQRVSVVGEFNCWDGRCHPMQVRGNGIWELFIPDLGPNILYKFEIKNRHNNEILLKSDPYGRQFELRPNTASIVTDVDDYEWQDADWMEHRKNFDWQHQPISIFEVHLGSWRRDSEGEFLNYKELAHQLVDYVKEMGFTHIELMPITEHPFDMSWGYQATGYYAPTSRYGTPDEFRYFVDYCHQNHIGVLLDWVPGHFPKDAHALARFDGTPLYEHEDPRKGEHQDWSTLIYNFSRFEVKNFLLSSALFWLEEFHMDGLRVDAVASMLYLDYSRTEWIPNEYGGNENLEAIDFLREMNTVVHHQCPGILTMAEESTSWPRVTKPVDMDGLGFDLKWNMGWMNDTLSYMEKDPIYRQHHHHNITFSMLYAFSENFALPFSHDEVVHGKKSMLYKMPGDEWQQFANLRLLYTYMFTHPGKKLLFMGLEFAQGLEWNSAHELDWYVLEYTYHSGVKSLVADLNHFYQEHPELYHYDFSWEGFEWIDCNDNQHSMLSFLRKAGNDFFTIVMNFTPVVRSEYRLGVPEPGDYVEIFNSNSKYYGGSNLGNGPDPVRATNKPWMDKPYSIELTVPPLSAIILKHYGS